MGEEAIQTARSYAMEAEHKIGEMLAETPRASGADKGGKPRDVDGARALPSNAPPTLADLGLTKAESSRAQMLASLPAPVFEAVRDGEKTLASVRREIAAASGKNKTAIPPLTLLNRALVNASAIEKAVSAKQDVANGHSRKDVFAKYGIASADYERLVKISGLNHAGLNKAINEGFVRPGIWDRIKKKTAEEIDEALEVIRIKANKPKSTRSIKKNFNSASMKELLYRTYMEWGGINSNVKINSHILPKDGDKLREMQRESRNVRTYVIKVLDSLDLEIEKCLQKIRG